MILCCEAFEADNPLYNDICGDKCMCQKQLGRLSLNLLETS